MDPVEQRKVEVLGVVVSESSDGNPLVSTISIMNFSGRILISKHCSHYFYPLCSVCTGLLSDFTKSKYGMPHSYSLVLVAVIFFISQIATASINNITHLWITSALIGLAYGGAFSLLPTVCLKWFGLCKSWVFSLPSFKFFTIIETLLYFSYQSAHFSENLGFLFMSPIVAGNLFSLLFSRNLDAHRSSPPNPTHNHPHLLI